MSNRLAFGQNLFRKKNTPSKQSMDESFKETPWPEMDQKIGFSKGLLRPINYRPVLLPPSARAVKAPYLVHILQCPN